ncbi:putative facilitator of salicylate uptake [hydrothermal vent metagenome]|uniref:Putative facilitator of salicylate uptake n=1 Tax=hydrothermal vent metagenome TaxID=652676 RepID=A0A1W1CZH7_9ZZZZ
MKTITKIVTLSCITATLLQATNGDNLIATSAKSRAMGGTGIAISSGSQSGLSNPALISSVEGTEISFVATAFMPSMETSLNGAELPAQAHSSDADFSIIPAFSVAHKLNENWTIGFGMWGTAGMGVDYSKALLNPAQGQLGNLNMETSLQLLEVGIPIAYKSGGLSLGITPILQYGMLNINYNMPTPTGIITIGDTEAEDDVSFGYSVGMAYDFSQDGVAGLTIGAKYKSAIEMVYGNELLTATGPFNQAPFPDVLPDNTLEQPAEYGVGMAYVSGQHTFAFDYKIIEWSNAKGYAEFGWEDSTVYAFGYQYTEATWALRAGYNRADSAVVEVNDPRLNFFNLLGFPATAEEHYTLGGSYTIDKEFSIDMAYVYSPESAQTYNVAPLLPGVDSISTTHTENSISLELVYKF